MQKMTLRREDLQALTVLVDQLKSQESVQLFVKDGLKGVDYVEVLAQELIKLTEPVNTKLIEFSERCTSKAKESGGKLSPNDQADIEKELGLDVLKAEEIECELGDEKMERLKTIVERVGARIENRQQLIRIAKLFGLL